MSSQGTKTPARDSLGRFVSASAVKQPLAKQQGKRLNAKYDAAQTTLDNMKHWAAADTLSATAANSPSVRRTLRMRARYEYLNNTYCKSMVRILADDLIGTMPHIQINIGNKEREAAAERAFSRWLRSARIPEKLRQMKRSQVVDGESFAILKTNPIIRGDVKLDIGLIEADRVAEPTGSKWFEPYADGITYDRYGNAASYRVLKHHPGDYYSNSAEYTTIPAKYMIHWFDTDRAEQERGIPVITPALPLFAQLRRYTLAVLASAETAADFSVFFKSQDVPTDAGPEELEAMETTEIAKRMATTLPMGWDVSQLKAEQPTTAYAEFKKEILNEIARAMNIPFNVAVGNSSDYNYASGRLDHQTYFKTIQIEQERFGCEVLDVLFEAWAAEAATLPGLKFLRNRGDIEHSWIFDGREHVDPSKEAKAQELRLANKTTTLADEYAQKGKDWETQLTQIAKEKQRMEELGISPAAAAQKVTEDDKEEDENE